MTVASSLHPAQAWIARSRLAAEGIRAFIADEHLAGTNWIVSQAIGGVKVQVAAADSARARELLCEDRSGVFGPPRAAQPGTICPQCGAAELYVERYARRAVFLSWLVLGIPVPIFRKAYRCLDCGWTERKRFRFRTQSGIRDLLALTLLAAVILSIAKMVGWSPGEISSTGIPTPR